MKLHEKHRGHESMHAEMILILFATLVISQIALVKWREIYPHSYHVRFKLFLFKLQLTTHIYGHCATATISLILSRRVP